MWLLVIVLATGLLALDSCFPGAAYAQPDSLSGPYRIAGPYHSIRVGRVLLYSTQPGIRDTVATDADTVYTISYRYSFTGRDSVEVEGIGVVPARGELRYLTRDSVIDIRSSGADSMIVAIPVRVTALTMAGGADGRDILRRDQYPSAARMGMWRSRGSFSTHVIRTLNQLFPQGYLPEEGGGRYFISTDWRQLGGVPSNLQARVAVLVSHPSSVSAGVYEFSVRFKAQERRRRDIWTDVSTPEVQTVVEAFMDNLLRRLEGTP